MQFLKADTNVEVLVGPAVAVGDGFTPVTTLSLSTADEAELIKHGGATALTVTSIASNTMAAITGADGYYTLDLTTGNLDTEGPLTILINDDSLILPIRLDFMVVNANVYDSLFAAAATDYLQVDTTQISGTTQTANDVGADVNAILLDTAEIGTAGAGLTNIGTIATVTNLTNLPSIPANWITTAGITDGAFTAAKFAASSLDGKGDWNVGKTGYSLTATTGLGNQTANITGNLSGSVGSVTGAVGSVTGAVGSVTGAVGSVSGNVDGNVTGSVGSNLELGPAEVNAEVVDAINTDTYAEPGQGTPAATATLAAKINYLYKAWRNKSTQTATTYSLYADDTTTVDQKATVSDDGTTATKGEVATGP